LPAHILIIEDNPANLELMRYLLEAFKYRVSAASGGGAIEAARLQRPNLILCDIQLPGIDGYGVLRRLREHRDLARIPVVAVTALAMVGDRDKVLAAGFNGYMSKPIDPEAFVPQVEAFLPPGLRNATAAKATQTSPGMAPLASAARTILVVDNLQVNLDLATSIFEGSGYRVVATTDPRQAVPLARRFPPDLILSDVCMPAASGYDLIARIKADPQLKAIPFVFITSTVTNENDRRKGLALGAVKFLFRPIDSQELLKEIESCLPRAGGA
jgi:two-component system cell cycle response regulator